jgi:hypothetical protein
MMRGTPEAAAAIDTFDVNTNAAHKRTAMSRVIPRIMLTHDRVRVYMDELGFLLELLHCPLIEPLVKRR